MAALNTRLAAIDLNLLVIFDAIMHERNVSRAAERVGLSQPAMSHALSRLRRTLKDELFVRTPGGMVPTPRAEQLALPIRQALDGLQHSLEPTLFDPSTAPLTFRIAVDNYAAIVLVGRLASRIAEAAPGVTVDFLPRGTLAFPDVLDNGEIDLAIGQFAEQSERVSRQLLMKDEFVAMLRKGRSTKIASKLSLEAIAAVPSLEISSVHYETDFIDRALRSRNLKRRIPLRAPLHCAVGILAASNMVSVFPRRMAKTLARNRPLAIRALGFPAPPIEAAMIWSRRLDNQAAHRWLRQMVSSVCESVRAS